jgi:DNA replication protein DnaC
MLAERQKAKAADLQRKRDADELAHAQQLANIDEKIAAEEQAHRDRQLAEDRTRALQQKQKDLETAISRTSQASATPSIRSDEHPSPPVQSAPKSRLDNTLPGHKIALDHSKPETASARTPIPTQPEVFSSAQTDWEKRKKVEGACNDAIDSIMELIGLEEVKTQVLRIYAKIELAKRQGTSLKDERLNIVLLGNPGTGRSFVPLPLFSMCMTLIM